MTSARPVRGASSTEPWQKISSTGVPFDWKYCSAMWGKLRSDAEGALSLAGDGLVWAAADHHLALANVEVDGREDVVVALHQHVAADDARDRQRRTRRTWGRRRA